MMPHVPDASPEAAQSGIDWLKVAYHFCRVVLALLFIVAGYDKILMPWNFGRAIYVYKILPGYLISPLAASMPWIELAAGILLVLNRFTRPAAIIIGGLNVVFLLAIGTVIARGMDIDCGCGLDVGWLAVIVGTQADGWALVRDLILLGMAATIYFGYKPKRN
jgi:uncharacterized membrane protein YphA (DoxX/SURF4 family)